MVSKFVTFFVWYDSWVLVVWDFRVPLNLGLRLNVTKRLGDGIGLKNSI